MNRPAAQDLIRFPSRKPPLLTVLVDAEEEFQWGTYSPTATSVRTMAEQWRAQRIFDRFSLIPTYAVDYPIASQAAGAGPLLEFLRDGKCEIGTQLHAWVNPPFEEAISVRNSFACNLPKRLEMAKLEHLTRTIEDTFGLRPMLYRAGRFGFGVNSGEALARLGYGIDCSIMPYMDLRPRQGPDHSHHGVTPFWFGPDGSLLELPATVGMVGALGKSGEAGNMHRLATSPLGLSLRLPGLLARLGVLDRIPLTPEGTTLDEAKKLTRWLLRQGHRVFTITYHSPSLEPGHTPYVRSRADLEGLLAWIEGYLDFFFGELGGLASTPGEVRNLAQALRDV